MDFKELIMRNAEAEGKRQARMAEEAAMLKERANAFAGSLDKNMLKAISKYGNRSMNFWPVPGWLKGFTYDNGVNNLLIAASEKFGSDGMPYSLYIIGGAYGINKNTNCCPVMVAVAYESSSDKRFEGRYHTNVMDAEVWTENNCDTRKFKGEHFESAVPLSNHVPADDSRNWFERAQDALPKFEEAFAQYLDERAKGLR